MGLNSLRTRLIAGLLIIGVLFTMLSSALQMRADYHHAQIDIEAELDIAGQSTAPLLSTALQNNQQGLVASTVENILALPMVHRVALTDERNSNVLQRGQSATQSRYISRQFTINTQQDSFTLSIHSDKAALRQELYRRVGTVLMTNALRTLVVALFVALFIDRLLMRHIRNVVRHLRDNPPGRPRKELSLQRGSQPRHDELDELVAAVNQMQCSLLRYESSLEEEKNRYSTLVENNPQAIWRCELAEPLHARWSIEHQLAHLVAHARVVEANQAALAFAKTSTSSGEDKIELAFLHDGLWRTLVNGNGRVTDLVTKSDDCEGRPHYLSNNVIAVYDGETCHTIWGISIDISTRIQAQQTVADREKQLQNSQQRLAESQALAHMGHWEYITAEDKLTVSDEFARIYGFQFDQPAPTWRDLIARVHPQDRDFVIHSLSRTDHDAAGAEHRIIWPNGEERHVQAVTRKRIENGKVSATFGIILDITDRRRAEQERERTQRALAESEARMAEAQAISHMGHWVKNYRDNSFCCSDELYRIYGHPPHAFPPNERTFNKQIHPDDKERIYKLLKEVRHRPISDDYRIVRPDGEVRYLRGTAKPFYSGGELVDRVFGVSVDVTEQTLAEQALQRSQQLLSTAFSVCPDGIAFVAENDLCAVAANPAFLRISGYDEEQLKHRGVEILKAVFAYDTALQLPLQTALAHYEKTNETPLRLTDNQGNTRHCLVSWRSVCLQNRKQKLIFLRDISELHELEAIAQKQNKQLLHADKLASLGTMVAGVAHEINNPNHIIQMNAALLADFSHQLLEITEDLPPPMQDALSFNGLDLKELQSTVPELFEDVINCSRRIDRIVKDLKEFARPRENAHYSEVDLNRIVENSLSLISSSVEDTPVQIHLELNPVPAVMGDSQQLQQVIINLVVNAVDASMDCAADQVVIHTHFDAVEQVVICDVSDQGCGIAAEHLGQIFDPFFTTKQEQGGTGLGLAISFRLVREHSGLLEADSQVGQGTTMRLALPAATSAHKNSPNPSIPADDETKVAPH